MADWPRAPEFFLGLFKGGAAQTLVALALYLSLKAGTAALTGAALLLWADKAMPQADVLALLLRSVSVGFIHRALDAKVLPQRVISRAHAALLFVSYLLLVLLLGWVLSTAISLALWVLLLMSAWHFMAWGWLALVAA